MAFRRAYSMTEPVTRAEFVATTLRLESADATNRLLLDNHIIEYRREVGDMKDELRRANAKLDTVIENQNRLKGRDGVVLFLIGAAVSICCTVIAASIMGALH